MFSESGIGGAERSLIRMVSSADQSGDVEYNVVTLGVEGRLSNWAADIGVPIKCFGRSGYKFEASSIVRLFSYLSTNKFDVIYAIGLKTSVYIRLFKLFNWKTVIVCGIRWNPTLVFTKLNLASSIIERLSNRLIGCYIANSVVATKNIGVIWGVKDTKTFVVHNGIEQNKDFLVGLDKRDFLVTTIANLSRRKGHIEYLQNVVRPLVNEHPKVKFLFLGTDYTNGAVQKEIDHLELSNNVLCLGFSNDVTRYLNQSRACVLPSLHAEGCPTSILEAMSVGCPVVAFSIDGIPELMSERTLGLIVQPGDYENMRAKIIDLLFDQQCFDTYSQASYDFMQTNFTIQQMVEKHRNVFLKMSV